MMAGPFANAEITIEDDVMFATNINITDALHGYDTANEPYKYQPMTRIAPITIKKGCWIGQNVLVMPGVTIGEYAIIGANSIVNKDIPARSIAVGNPAKVIKSWNETTQTWDKVDGIPADDSSDGSLKDIPDSLLQASISPR